MHRNKSFWDFKPVKNLLGSGILLTHRSTRLCPLSRFLHFLQPLIDYVLIVYSSMEHVTWKSPGPMCGWVGRILHPDSCTSVSSCPKCLFYPSGLSLCLSVDHFCLVPVGDMVLFHGMVCDGWLVSYTALPCPGGSGLCTSCERVHFCLVFLDPQTKLPACLSNLSAGAILARQTIDFQVTCSIKL